MRREDVFLCHIALALIYYPHVFFVTSCVRVAQYRHPLLLGIRSNAIHPGIVGTALLRNIPLVKWVLNVLPYFRIAMTKEEAGRNVVYGLFYDKFRAIDDLTFAKFKQKHESTSLADTMTQANDQMFAILMQNAHACKSGQHRPELFNVEASSSKKGAQIGKAVNPSGGADQIEAGARSVSEIYRQKVEELHDNCAHTVLQAESNFLAEMKEIEELLKSNEKYQTAGKYFTDMRLNPQSSLALDPEIQDHIWNVSERLVIDFMDP